MGRTLTEDQLWALIVGLACYGWVVGSLFNSIILRQMRQRRSAHR